MVFCQKLPNIDSMILLHHLKELTLSFQKNIISLQSDTPNKSYGHSKINIDVQINHCMSVHTHIESVSYIAPDSRIN